MSDRNVRKWFGPSLPVTLHDSLLTRLSLTSIGWQLRVEPGAGGTGGGWNRLRGGLICVCGNRQGCCCQSSLLDYTAVEHELNKAR